MSWHIHAKVLLCLALCSPLSASSIVDSPPTTSDVSITASDGEATIDYSLAGVVNAALVTVVFTSEPERHLRYRRTDWSLSPDPQDMSGDVGFGIHNGNRRIVWNFWRHRYVMGNINDLRPQVSAVELGVTRQVYLSDDISLEMVRIPASPYIRGSTYDPPWTSTDESPLTSVTIKDEFYLGKYPVTQAQWMAVMGDFPREQPARDDALPVVFVSWNDCQAFIERLALLGHTGFRLPTEAEWEYACRAGATTRWYCGDDPECLETVAWYERNNAPYGPKPVGGKEPNTAGLYDMHGNVLEWVRDRWRSNHRRRGTEAHGNHVLRGGHFASPAAACRSAARNSAPPNARYVYYGLRLAQTPDIEDDND